MATPNQLPAHPTRPKVEERIDELFKQAMARIKPDERKQWEAVRGPHYNGMRSVAVQNIDNQRHQDWKALSHEQT